MRYMWTSVEEVVVGWVRRGGGRGVGRLFSGGWVESEVADRFGECASITQQL